MNSVQLYPGVALRAWGFQANLQLAPYKMLSEKFLLEALYRIPSDSHPSLRIKKLLNNILITRTFYMTNFIDFRPLQRIQSGVYSIVKNRISRNRDIEHPKKLGLAPSLWPTGGGGLPESERKMMDF